jgi:hypothetical protein
LAQEDDVPCYVDFVIIPPEEPQYFPTSWYADGGSEQINFTLPRWENIVGVLDAYFLQRQQFANIKVVRSIRIQQGGPEKLGFAVSDCSGTMLLSAEGAKDPYAVLHEYGHAVGLLHVGEGTVLYPCDTPNPGDPYNFNRLMHPSTQLNEGGAVVNRFERDQILNTDLPLWGALFIP